MPGTRLPPHPLDLAIGPHKAIFVSSHDSALEWGAVRCLRTFRNFAEKGVMRLASNVPVSETVVRHPASTGGNVAHLSVEHGQGRWRMFDEYLKHFLALAQLLFNLLALRNVRQYADHPYRRAISRHFEICG